MAECLDDDIPVLDNPNAQSTIPCDDCEGTEDVFSYCLDCPGALCDKCKEGHQRRKITRSHKVVNYSDSIVENSKKVSALGKCAKHPGNAMVAYCERCGITCCSHCLAADHKNHPTKEIFEKYNAVKSNIEQFIQRNETTLKALEADISETESDIRNEIAKATKLEVQLNLALKSIRDVFEKEGDKVRETIKAQKEKNILSLRRHIYVREKEKTKCQKVIAESNRFLNTDFNTVLKFDNDKPMPQQYKVVPKQLPSTSLNAGKLDMQTVQKMIGQVHISEPPVQRTVQESRVQPPRLTSHDLQRRSEVYQNLGRRIAYGQKVFYNIQYGLGPAVLENGEIYFNGKMYETEEWQTIITSH